MLSTSDFIAIALAVLVPLTFLSVQLFNIVSLLKEINAELIKINVAMKYNPEQYMLHDIATSLFKIITIIDVEDEELEEE